MKKYLEPTVETISLSLADDINLSAGADLDPDVGDNED